MALSKTVHPHCRTRFVRLSLVILEELTPLMQDILQNEISPSQILNQVSRHKSLFQKLRSEQIMLIQNAQNDGYGGFDITLTYTLLRNLKGMKITAPTQGWGTSQMPGNGETTLGDDIERIRLIRNKVYGYATMPSLSEMEFKEHWSNIAGIGKRMEIFLGKKYLNRLLSAEVRGIHIEMESTYLEKIKNLSTAEKSMRELLQGKVAKLTESLIPPNVKDQHNIEYIQKWREEDKRYCETHSFPSIMEKIRNQPYITIVGGSGSGKSAMAHHIALKLQEEGYEIVPTKDVRKMEDYGDPRNPQVFVIDDVVGVFGLQKTKLDLLTDYEPKITTPCMVKSRTLMTCREAVFNETLPYKPFLTKEETVIRLHSSDHELDDNDKKQILQKYGLNENLMSPALLKLTSIMFPLLCKLYSKETKYQALGYKFFLNPVQCFIDELDEMQRHNKLNYATLVLCMLNGNSISKDILKDRKNKDMNIDTLENCRLRNNTNTFEFMDALSAMEGTYTKLSGAQYTFIHDSMFETCVYHYGKQFPDHMLLYMNSSYIANSVKPQTSESDDKSNEREESFDLCVRLREDQYPLLAERLYRDIQNMELYDVFRNPVLKHPQVCQAFIGVLETKSYTELKSLFLSSHGEVDKIGRKRKHAREEREKMDVLVDQIYKRNDKGERIGYTCNVRVISWVIYYGHHQIIEYIIQQTAQHNETSELYAITGNSPAQSKSGIYAGNGQESENNRLVEQCRLLLLSCYNGDVQTVRILFPFCQKTINGPGQISEDISWCDHTPLIAACEGGHVIVAKELLMAGADVNLQGVLGITPLIAACKGGHVSVVEELVKAGADVNIQNKLGDIPLISAFEGGHTSVVEKLVKAGAGIPMQIYMRGNKSIQNFIKNLKRGKQKIYHASGMIIGCAGSGKTTLLKRLQGITVKEIENTTKSTRGVDVLTDVFDVTDTLQVSNSDRPPRFQMTVDKPDHSNDKTNDDQLVQDVKDMDNDQMHKDVTNHQMQEKNDQIHEDMKDKHINVDRKESKEEDAIIPQSLEPNDSEEVSEEDDTMGEASFLPQQVSTIIPVSQGLAKGDKIHLPQKISMTDFAGQCAYYASHQIFLSPRAFFLLVLNMKKNLDDVVDKEVCCQKGSVYEKWTYGEYVEFWLKSVHQYSGGKAPVLLVTTHCEKMADKERRAYFWNLRKTLSTKDKSLLEHLTRDRNFSVSFDDETEIEKIKSSIVETVQNLDHWGQDLPQSWVLFETFLLDEKKKEKKILKRDEVMDFNKALNEDIQLSDDDIDFMLQFFHDIREILYFDQRDLKDAIILDIQWFSNAFKHIITDENHAKEDLYDYVMEWETFNKTGVLDGQLLDAIWNIHPDNDYISHKKEIMLYMEKLGLLAVFADGEEKWYVPSMNKIPFQNQKLQHCPSSSILCFQFDALPVGIFHRLVALCIQVPFEIVACEDEQCIYQTAAIFIHGDGHHHFVIGMSKSAIQLQAFVFSGNVDPRCCHQIRQKVEGIINTSSNTFQSNLRFSVGYKCKSSGFCDEEESAIIPEEKFTKASFDCSGCPLGKKHKIETNSIIKYWKQCVQLKGMLPEDTTDSETKTNPHRGIAYPFAKNGPQEAVMTSCIKADVSKSVGRIYLPGGGGGTGFRVGTKFIMTCLHVIEGIVQADGTINCGKIKIQFGMVESISTHNNDTLFHFEPTLCQHKELDLAILELKHESGKSFPPQLTLSTTIDLTLAVHLLGHPGGVEMKEDRVFVYEIQPSNDVDQYINKLSHWGKSNLPENIDYYEILRKLPRKILFNTTFDGGSSGGPGIKIQNDKPYVVLMISGGVPDCHYKNVHLVQHDERIEYGYAMEDIYKEMTHSADDNVKRIAAEIFSAVH